MLGWAVLNCNHMQLRPVGAERPVSSHCGLNVEALLFVNTTDYKCNRYLAILMPNLKGPQDTSSLLVHLIHVLRGTGGFDKEWILALHQGNQYFQEGSFLNFSLSAFLANPRTVE